MTKQHFNFEELFSFAWSKTKQHAWFLVCTAFIYALIISATKGNHALELLTILLIALSLVSISIKIVRGDSFTFTDLFNPLRSPRIVLKFLALTAIYTAVVAVFFVPFIASLSVIAGTMLFYGYGAVNAKLITVLLTTLVMLIPGIFVVVRFKFYPYVLLENEHMKIVDIIKTTYRLTCCAFWKLLGFFIVLGVFNLVGALAFGVGLLFTVPVSIFAFAHLFRKLEGHTH